VDWTLHEDWDIEQRPREERNKHIKERLLAGKNVCYRSSGNSLWPTVKSGDLCEFEPIKAASADDSKLMDIVFCEVQPGDRFYAHLFLRKETNDHSGKTRFIIGNKSGYENGWCFLEHIYGRLRLAGWR